MERTVIRICTAASSYVGGCDHCATSGQAVVYSAEQVITVVTMHRGDDTVFVARFCEKHFLQFSDLISEQVAALLYPKTRRRM
jgi:hypothetical protein